MSGEHHYFATTLTNWWALETATEAIALLADFCGDDDFWVIYRVPGPKDQKYSIDKWRPQVPGTLAILGSSVAVRDGWIDPVVSIRDLESHCRLMARSYAPQEIRKGIWFHDAEELCRNHGFDP